VFFTTSTLAIPVPNPYDPDPSSLMLSHHPSDNRTWMDAHCFIAGLSSENASKGRYAGKTSNKGMRNLFRISYPLKIAYPDQPALQMLGEAAVDGEDLAGNKADTAAG